MRCGELRTWVLRFDVQPLLLLLNHTSSCLHGSCNGNRLVFLVNIHMMADFVLSSLFIVINGKT